MGGEEASRGIALQRQLSEFLHAELLHTLGAYRYACEGLHGLEEELDRQARETKTQTKGERRLAQVLAASIYCNEQLRDHLHRAAPADADETAANRRPSPFRPGEEPPRPSEGLLTTISTFYADAAVALSHNLEDPRGAEQPTPRDIDLLGANFAFVHDPQRRGDPFGVPRRKVTAGKIERMMERHADALELVPRGRKPPRPLRVPPKSDAQRKERFADLLASCAGGHHGEHMLAVLTAMGEAHMWMHQAEHVRAQNFGSMFSGIPETHADTQDMLRYSLVLNTFVFAGARAAPWVFAEDADERDYVIRNYPSCCETLAPTYSMWIATQLSLLSLHRRAFTYWTMGEHDSAYRDFHKLTRLLRGLRKPAERRGLRVPGTKTFIEGISGMSEHHIGRIYRGQHAHRMALRYFKRASRRLGSWEKDAEIGRLVKNSHWRINLLINVGKAHYELGRVKRSFLHYAQAWRAFLLLVESETHAAANVDVAERFIEWLEPTIDDPELSRRDLRDRVEPLVEQFATLRTPPHLRLLAADIVMRVGHLLFVLKLPPADEGRRPDGGREMVRSDHDLASRCVAKAAFLDPTSTLTGADLLRIEQDTGRAVTSEEPIEMRPLRQQWPSGSGRFEEAARIAEYTLQRWLAATEPTTGRPAGPARRRVAREMLGSFLAHTDSTNVKLAQVYRYLMQKPSGETRDASAGEHALEFLCLRRYSSFFPFLPRPSAFRAPGGGYFVRVNEPGKDPFGIAIDPGPDFIDNLYRCGFSLADVRMIVLTHDHADHIVSLDSMLALMGIRKGLGDPTFDKEGRRLAIVGNESVRRRYSFYNCEKHPTHRKRSGKPASRIDAVRVLSFEQIARITGHRRKDRRQAAIEEKEILLEPETLRIEPVRTWGHADANGFVSQGFLLSVGKGQDRSSMLFTGDTGKPPARRSKRAEHGFAAGSKSLRDAVAEADVVVAHLSSVPLRELRVLAGLDDAGGEQAAADFTRLWSEAAKRTRDPVDGADPDRAEGVRLTKFLLKQVQFGFRARPAEERDGLEVSPFSDVARIKEESPTHLYLTGLLEVAEAMASRKSAQAPLLLIGELREELGTFRTRIAHHISEAIFDGAEPRPRALTTDIGLRVRVSAPAGDRDRAIRVLCTTCDLDNDLVTPERFHEPEDIHEVCVKGEDEGVFYNCSLHDPRAHDDHLWLERVERYDVFGD